MREVLDRRQPDLTVLLDNVHKPHNLSAILRSCDAVGVYEAHAVWPGERVATHHLTSGGSRKWIGVATHPSVEAGCAALRELGMRVLAAHPSPESVDYRDVDYTAPSALLLGAELAGVSAAGLEQADVHVNIPMLGMVGSLNVSVAAAAILLEAQRQRLRAGLYDVCRLDPARRERTLFEWAHPHVARHCRRAGRPYPALDEEGELLDRTSWR